MGASLPFSRSRDPRADMPDSQNRSSVRLPEALRPLARAMRRSASRVRRGGDLARVRGIRYFIATIDAMFSRAIAFVDLETTGTVSRGDRITEIGIVRVADGEFADEWSTLVNPECSIPEEIRALTGITNEMVRGAPTFSQVRHEVFDRLDGHVFVAHNARFDYGFLKHEFRRVGMPFTADVLCTVRLARRLYPEAIGHGLDALIARHGLTEPFLAAGGAQPPEAFSRTGRHSALGDARAIWRFVQMLYRERDGEEIEAAVKRLLKIPSLPPQLPPDALEHLP